MFVPGLLCLSFSLRCSLAAALCLFLSLAFNQWTVIIKGLTLGLLYLGFLNCLCCRNMPIKMLNSNHTQRDSCSQHCTVLSYECSIFIYFFCPVWCWLRQGSPGLQAPPTHQCDAFLNKQHIAWDIKTRLGVSISTVSVRCHTHSCNYILLDAHSHTGLPTDLNTHTADTLNGKTTERTAELT